MRERSNVTVAKRLGALRPPAADLRNRYQRIDGKFNRNLGVFKRIHDAELGTEWILDGRRRSLRPLVFDSRTVRTVHGVLLISLDVPPAAGT